MRRFLGNVVSGAGNLFGNIFSNDNNLPEAPELETMDPMLEDPLHILPRSEELLPPPALERRVNPALPSTPPLQRMDPMLEDPLNILPREDEILPDPIEELPLLDPGSTPQSRGDEDQKPFDLEGFGRSVSTYSPLVTTILNRLGDRPNENFYPHTPH